VKAPITQLGGVTGGLSADPDAPMRTIQTEPLSLFVGTWNMGDSVPPPALEGWIPREAHDLYAVATQECSDEHWLAALDSHLGSSYVRITERRMGSIFLVVFTHRRHAAKISSVESSYIPTGVLGVGTNKGAVALAFNIRGLHVCIVNAHLAAHQDKLLQRNRHVQDITKHLRLGVTSLELPVQFHTVWCGDLNYRIDEGRAEVLRLVEAEQWHTLHEVDQLSREIAAHRVLYGFSEGLLNFPPTYKYVRQQHVAPRRRGFRGLRSKPSFPRSRGKEGSPESREKDKAHSPSLFTVGASGGTTSAAAADDCAKAEHGPSHCYETPSRPPIGGGTVSGAPDSSPGADGGRRRPYDEEKLRVPSWCDRVLWRSVPGPYPITSSSCSDCDDPSFWASDHTPVSSVLDFEVPVLPDTLPLHHCTIYLSNLYLYRARPAAKSDAVNTFATSNLTARSAMGKGVPLPVASNKLQNLPPQLTVYAHLVTLHKLMVEPPQLAAALSADGKGSQNIVIGPMLVQREYLKLQGVQLRVSSLSGGKPLELGQAIFSLNAAAHGKATDFDVLVEHQTCPAGFNLAGTVSVVYTKTLGADAWLDTSRPASCSVADRAAPQRAQARHHTQSPSGARRPAHDKRLHAARSRGGSSLKNSDDPGRTNCTASGHCGGLPPRPVDCQESPMANGRTTFSGSEGV